MIILNDIAKEYIQGKTNVTVLNKLCLHVNYNENVGIIGPSGSGKSTLLNLIWLLEQPSSGNIKICNVDLNELKEEEKIIFRKENIGFIFQNNQLLEDFNVEENIALPLLMNGNSFRKSISKANDYLHLLGISDRNKFKPGLLSGGEQQRVSIARALLNEPELIIADEPTCNLDPETSRDIMKLLKSIQEKGKAIFMATHDYSLINDFPSKMIRCTKGTVILVEKLT